MGRDRKYKSSVYQTFALVTQFGISMLVPIFLCAFLGKFLDDTFGTTFWFIVLFFAGALAGFRNIYVMAKKTYENDENKDDFENIRKSLQQERELKEEAKNEGTKTDI